MMHRSFGILVLLNLFFLMVLSGIARGFNPNPAENDLLLPMPNGLSMVFRPVFIGEDGSPFAQRRFKVGDPDGGYKEYPASVTIGGAFVDEKNGGQDWLYYMGKYEVTEKQYALFADPEVRKRLDSSEGDYPVRNITWFDALQFADKYNQWLFAHAVKDVPKHENVAGFVRLPTEVEWEFAARGGAQVSPEDFDRKQPYQGRLAAYEWFSGPRSSHNECQIAGVLTPNPLGIHDMLGNVSEMTTTAYQIEYYQGRTGGFVARGGHYFTPEKSIRSSLRTEEPFYLGDAKSGHKPNRKSIMGFRLVLSSQIYTSMISDQKFRTAWEEYRKGKGASLPAAVSVAPTSKQTGVEKEDAKIVLDRLSKKIKKRPDIFSEVNQDLGLLKVSLEQIDFKRKTAEKKSAYAWVRVAGQIAAKLHQDLRKLPELHNMLDKAKKVGRTRIVEQYKMRIDEIQTNIDDALGSYSTSLEELNSIDANLVDSGFGKYTGFLIGKKSADQIRISKIVQNHFHLYQKEQRANPGKWRQDFNIK